MKSKYSENVPISEPATNQCSIHLESSFCSLPFWFSCWVETHYRPIKFSSLPPSLLSWCRIWSTSFLLQLPGLEKFLWPWRVSRCVDVDKMLRKLSTIFWYLLFVWWNVADIFAAGRTKYRERTFGNQTTFEALSRFRGIFCALALRHGLVMSKHQLDNGSGNNNQLLKKCACVLAGSLKNRRWRNSTSSSPETNWSWWLGPLEVENPRFWIYFWLKFLLQKGNVQFTEQLHMLPRSLGYFGPQHWIRT